MSIKSNFNSLLIWGCLSSLSFTVLDIFIAFLGKASDDPLNLVNLLQPIVRVILALLYGWFVLDFIDNSSNRLKNFGISIVSFIPMGFIFFLIHLALLSSELTSKLDYISIQYTEDVIPVLGMLTAFYLALMSLGLIIKVIYDSIRKKT